MKIAVIGLGSIGKRHTMNLISQGVKPEEIYGVDPREDRRQESKERFGLTNIVADHKELDGNQFDGAVICSPTSMHIQQGIWFAERGAHLFIEKPLCSDLEGIEELKKVLNEKNRQTLITYPFRFSNHARKLKELVDQNAVGKVLYFRGDFSEYLPDWHPYEDYRSFYMAKKSLGGGSILDQSHILDMSHFLFGEINEVLSCFNERVSGLEVEADDIAEMTLKYKSGLVGTIHQDMFGRQHKKYMEIKGELGNIYWDVYDLSVTVYKAESKSFEKFTFGKDHNVMYINQTQHMLNILNGKEKSIVPLEEGIHTMQVIHAAERAHQEKKSISL